MRPDRRALLGGALLGGALAAVATRRASAAEPIRLVDITGQEVVLPAPARRLVLAQGRHLNALSLLHPDPVGLIAGWSADLKRDTSTYDLYRRAFPHLDAVPVLSQSDASTFSIERAIALDPDLVVLSRDADAAGLGTRFKNAGIPTLAIDFFRAPLASTEASLRILAKAIGQEERARAFNAFYRTRIDRVAARLADPDLARPRVFMHAHAGGPQCCFSPGRGTLNDFIRLAGGHNLGADVIPGATGELSREYVAGAEPQVYIGTGGTYQRSSGGLVLGSDVSAEAARDSLASTVARLNLAAISALPPERVHGLWHYFNDTPAHVLAVERLAKWLHPARFADIDPDASLAEINARFAAVPLRGTYWTSLRPGV